MKVRSRIIKVTVGNDQGKANQKEIPNPKSEVVKTRLTITGTYTLEIYRKPSKMYTSEVCVGKFEKKKNCKKSR